jgi:predicted phosphate transport protein (TIGR00153 family)
MKLKKKDMDFYESFVRGVEFALRSANMLKDIMDSSTLTEDAFHAIKKVEQEADNHMHEISEQLNDAFITPIDRDDIHKIANETDDIVDDIESVSNHLWMMHVTQITDPMKAMAKLNVEACEKLLELMSELKRGKRNSKLYELVVEINRIEEMGDRCYKDALRELFDTEKDAIELIKKHKIYDELENALDDCEDVANLVEGIIITKT